MSREKQEERTVLEFKKALGNSEKNNTRRLNKPMHGLNIIPYSPKKYLLNDSSKLVESDQYRMILNYMENILFHILKRNVSKTVKSTKVYASKHYLKRGVTKGPYASSPLEFFVIEQYFNKISSHKKDFLDNKLKKGEFFKNKLT